MTPQEHQPVPQTWQQRVDWRTIALVLVAAILIYQVLFPLVMVVWGSLKATRPGDPGYLSLHFTLDNYVRAFSSEAFWVTTRTTLSFAVAVTCFSFILGTFLAWVVERTDTPMRRIIGLLTVGRMIIPGILIAVAWVLVASPAIGILNRAIEAVTGIKALFNIYGFWGMVWVETLDLTPTAYLLMSAAFHSMDPTLEEASTMTGAGIARTLRRVTLPLVVPATAATLILLFIRGLETFEVPVLIGIRERVFVYSTAIFLKTTSTPTDLGLASAYAMALLVLAPVLLWLYFRATRHGERFSVISGKAYRPRRIELGGWRHVTLAFGLLLVFLITGVPFLTLLYASFLPTYQIPGPAVLEQMNVKNYLDLLTGTGRGAALPTLWNSTLVGIGSATAVMLLVSTTSYFVHKTQVRGRKILDLLSFLPIGLPSMLVAVAFMWFYLVNPLPIYGTLTIIGLAYITKYMPIAMRFASASVLQIHSELEEAAAVTGVPWWKNFVHIYLPLLRPGFMAGWIWVMIHAFRELTIALMLVSSGNETSAYLIYDLWDHGSITQVGALGVVMFVVLVILVVVAHRIGQRFGVQEQG